MGQGQGVFLLVLLLHSGYSSYLAKSQALRYLTSQSPPIPVWLAQSIQTVSAWKQALRV